MTEGLVLPVGIYYIKNPRSVRFRASCVTRCAPSLGHPLPELEPVLLGHINRCQVCLDRKLATVGSVDLWDMAPVRGVRGRQMSPFHGPRRLLPLACKPSLAVLSSIDLIQQRHQFSTGLMISRTEQILLLVLSRR